MGHADTPPRLQGRRAGLLRVLLVLLGHAALWLALDPLLRPVQPRPPAMPAPTIAWLRPAVVLPTAATPPPRLEARPERTPRVKQPTPQPAPAPVAQPVRRATSGTQPPDPAPITLPGSFAPSLAAAPLPAASAPAARALNLTLPRGPANAGPSPAAEAARLGQTAPPSRDERLAQALGTDTALRETMRGEVRRFQQGRGCADVRPSREAGLNPFNQSTHATPRQAQPC